jgi:L-alanine-DL-glutamate epimerase-like enolase superfamily enzyme
MLSIHRVEITLLTFPLERPFSNHAHPVAQIYGIYVKIFADDKIGHSFIYSLRKIPYDNIVKYIKEIAEFRSDWDVFWKNYKKQHDDQERLTALAAVDIAMWDLLTKIQGISLHKYLGAAQTKIPVYATTGWLSLSTSELIAECQSYTKQGINAFKTRLGHPDDLVRVETLRNEMGRDFILMTDANQRYADDKAIQVSKDIAKFNITWLEEPTDYTYETLVKVKKNSKIKVALGENITQESDFQKICEEKLTDYLQPDLPRCGGITGFCQAATIAQQHKIPLCSHLMPQLSISLVAAYTNGVWIEYDNLLPDGIFTHNFIVKEGVMQPPDISGTGVELTPDALKKFHAASYAFNYRPSPILSRCKL